MKLIRCDNPFDSSRDRQELTIIPGQSLAEVLNFHDIDLRKYVASCNGELIHPNDAGSIFPSQGDYIVVKPILENQTLKSIAMIGVMAAATIFAGPMGALLMHGLSGVMTASMLSAMTPAMISAVGAATIMVGGTLLVGFASSLLQKKDPGASYTWDGAQTTARSGIPIPKGYGTFRAAGNVVESWVDMQNADADVHDTDDGADKIGRQWMNIRNDFGYGPVHIFSDIRINDKDIYNYADVAYCPRLGANTQTPVTSTDSGWTVINRTTTGDTQNTAPTTDFNRINNNYPISQRVRCGIAHNYVIIPGRRKDTQRLEVVVQFPDGVWRLDDSNVIKRAAVYYQVFYKQHGATSWTLAQNHNYINIRQTILRQRTVIDSLPADCYDVMVVKLGSGAVSNPIDYFEHESNKWGDQLWVESVQETSYTALAYPNFAQLCLRVMATDQLSGGGLNVSALVKYACRATRPAQLAGFADDNPAVVAYDILSDPMAGAGVEDSRIDLDSFQEWAELCDTLVDDGNGGTQKLAVFNGVFDQDGKSIWDAFQTICVMSRATPQRIGTKIGVILDKPEDPVMMFNVGNILKDSYSKEELSLDDRAEEVEVEFADAEDDYKTRIPLRVITTEDIASSEILKKTRVNLIGCTNKVQAYYWGYHHLLKNKLTKYTHTWDSPADAIACRNGKVVWLQHDLPNYGFGGNVVSAAGLKVQLDRPDIKWSEGDTATLMVKHAVLNRGTRTFTTEDGQTIFLNDVDFNDRVLRAVIGGIEYPVIGQGESEDDKYIRIDGVLPTGSGNQVTLYDLDALEERNVVSIEGDTVTLESAFSAVPADGSGYIFQSSSNRAIKVRIKSIKRKTDQKFTIVAEDYNPAQYDIPAPDADLSNGSGATPEEPGSDDGSGDGGGHDVDPPSDQWDSLSDWEPSVSGGGGDSGGDDDGDDPSSGGDDDGSGSGEYGGG